MEKNGSKKNCRDQSIDCVKGIAIIAVVVHHLGFSLPYNDIVPSKALLYSLWHVPVFFVLAGFFLSEDKLQRPVDFIKKKIKTLYLKTILFVSCAVIFHNVLIKIGWYSESLDYSGKKMFFYTAKDFVFKLAETIFFMGREPITGALWFGYVLFIALCGYSVLSFFLGKIIKENQDKLFLVKGLILFFLTIVSNILSQNFGITQNRFSNIFPAMLLIYMGQWLNVEKKCSFNSKYVALFCLLVVAQAAFRSGGIGLNNNNFYDVFHLLSAGGGMTYLLLFIFKKAKVSVVNRILCFFGKYSFAIMALHLLCFKPCMILSNRFLSSSFNIGSLTPDIGSQYGIFVFFLMFSVSMPAFLGFCFDKIIFKE